MNYTKLPEVKKHKPLDTGHFPSRFHCAVFRLWETVPADKIARGLGTNAATIQKAAEDMGLPPQRYTDKWDKLGYITTIRNAWHMLPYDQLLAMLGWSEDKLANVLKEDDFLYVKLGDFKPYCEPVRVESADQAQLEYIKDIMQQYFPDYTGGAVPFEFFSGGADSAAANGGNGLRMVYSYCGLYATALDNDTSLSYPEELLAMYRDAGVNAVWLPVVLYQMVPFPFDESYSQGWELRQQRLRQLIATAKKYDIDVYLYLNEPRCMPKDFFRSHSGLLGTEEGTYGALCTSLREVMDYLRYAVRRLCTDVPGIGGFFAITMSENLTHCKSRAGKLCSRCRDIPAYKLVADVVSAISEESRKADPDIRTIAWTWAWDDYMTKDEIKACIDLLPKEVIIQCNSEAQKEFTIGGVSGNIRDYSMSIPGPAPLAEYIWDYASSKGHEVCAKVQVNVTWECSTLPFLPVFDLIREHMCGLRATGVEHLMLSWTLGGYPSVNLKVASACLADPDEGVYDKLLRDEYGEYAPAVKAAATQFSDAFREFPFDLSCIYYGPQNSGPSNLLYLEPTGFEATMTCYAYDDLDKWRSIYPRDVYISQLKKLADGWKKGLDIIEDMPDCDFRQAAWGGYALFYSSYLQAEFVDKRRDGDKEYLAQLVAEEKKMALLMYELMRKNSLFGYEAANHYYFNRAMLAEKVINCEYIQCGIRNA